MRMMKTDEEMVREIIDLRKRCSFLIAGECLRLEQRGTVMKLKS